MRARYNAWDKHFSKKPEVLKSKIFQNYLEAAKKALAAGRPVKAAKRLTRAIENFHAKGTQLPKEARKIICQAADSLIR